MPQGLYGFDRVEEGLTVLMPVGETRGKAPKDRGKAESEERDERRGGESLDVGTGRLRGSEPLGGILRDSVGGKTLSLDVPDASVEEEEDVEEEEEEEEEGGLLLFLDAGVLPWGCCRRRGWARWAGAVPYAEPQAKCSSPVCTSL